MSTTSAQGGYLIPETWYNEIVNMINNYAQVPGLCREIQMTASTVHLNSYLTDLTVGWSTEATAKTTTKPTFSQGDLTLRFVYAIITATNELLRGSIVNIDQMLKELVAQNIALEIEQEILEGTTFTGLSTAGINNVNLGGASLNSNDLINVINNTGQLEVYKKASTWVMNRSAVSLIMKLVDGSNRPMWLPMNNPLTGKQEVSLLGYPYVISDQISGSATTASPSTIYFGDFKQVYLGKRAGFADIDVLWSNTAVIDSSTAVSENAFTENKEMWRIEKETGLIVAVPSAFVKLANVQ